MPLQHADEEVALEACEFWGAYCEAELDNAQLRPFLPQVSGPATSQRRHLRASVL